MSTKLDYFPLSDLQDRYSIGLKQVYSRLTKLSIKPEKFGDKAFINASQLEKLDRLDKHEKSEDASDDFVFQCKYCGHSYSKLAKAHIIPRSFYKTIKGSENFLEYKVKEKFESTQQIWQSGFHDSDIVCDCCEKRFCKFDTHGVEVLSAALSKKIICDDSVYLSYLIENVDYHKFKLFFLSILWRAHASSLDFFANVNLGSHESILRSNISSGIAPPSDKYEIVLFYITDKILLPPWKDSDDGVDIYRFYLPNLLALIKVDNQPLPQHYNSLVLKETPPYRLLFYPPHNSEQQYIEEIIKKVNP